MNEPHGGHPDDASRRPGAPVSSWPDAESDASPDSAGRTRPSPYHAAPASPYGDAPAPGGNYTQPYAPPAFGSDPYGGSASGAGPSYGPECTSPSQGVASAPYGNGASYGNGAPANGSSPYLPPPTGTLPYAAPAPPGNGSLANGSLASGSLVNGSGSLVNGSSMNGSPASGSSANGAGPEVLDAWSPGVRRGAGDLAEPGAFPRTTARPPSEPDPFPRVSPRAPSEPGPFARPSAGLPDRSDVPRRRRRHDADLDEGRPATSSRVVPTRRSLRARTRTPASPAQAAFGALFEVVVVLGMALGLSLLIKTFLVQAFFIPSPSMNDTLLVGDRVLVSKLTPGPVSLKHGDVVVFKDPGGWLPTPAPLHEGPFRHGLRVTLTFVGLLPQDSGEHLIKRVIGLPGDKVVCCDAQGRLQVNGTSIIESYVRPGNAPSTEKFDITVKKDHLWVMGDNRSESADSRFHPEIDGGQVPVANVVGKAFAIVWPFDRFGGVVEPPDVFARVPAATMAQ